MNNTITRWQDIDTTGWDKYEFEWKGWRFISSISLSSPLSSRIKSLPDGAFSELNKQALDELTKHGETIHQALERINEGASHAIVSLA